MAANKAYRVMVRFQREHIINAPTRGQAADKARGLYKASQEPNVIEVHELMADPVVQAEIDQISENQILRALLRNLGMTDKHIDRVVAGDT